MTHSTGRSSLRSTALASALAEEVSRLEKAMARAWQVLAGLGLLVALGTVALVPGNLGWATLVLSGCMVAYFTLVLELIRRGRGQAVLRLVSPLVEITLPWVTLMILVETQGPGYAMGSWVPPMLYSGLMATSILRLRARVPVFMGFVASAQYALSYIFILHPMLTPAQLAEPLLAPRMQLVRAFTLVIGGTFVGALTTGLRWAIGTAARTVRARELFGKYRLEREIAQGGMGVVYQALYCPEGGFQRPVAIKRIHPHLASQPRFVSAFRGEAELCARLVHANIVQVLDFGRVDDTYFLAMEYVDGLTLQQLSQRLQMQDRRMPVGVVALILQELLRGLEYAHTGAMDADGRRLRVIHRDLSPHNVLLARTGQVKVSDFGIARALGNTGAAVTSTVMGHFSHMAPEQAEGRALDERCDLFAAGILAWEMLTGRSLFQRDNEAAILLAVLEADIVKPSEAAPGLDPAWDGVVMRALERDPARRFASAADMRAALEEASALQAGRPEDLMALLASVVDVVPDDDRSVTVRAQNPTQGPGDAGDVTRTERKR